jgi:hypothetical protein
LRELGRPKVILAEDALQVVALGKALVVTRTDRPAQYLNIDQSGLAEAATDPSQRNRASVTAGHSAGRCDRRGHV